MSALPPKHPTMGKKQINTKKNRDSRKLGKK
jgi:hypothetical protein